MERRTYGSGRGSLDVPSLVEPQQKFYVELLQADAFPTERKKDGLQSVFEEIFPITSYDGALSLEFLHYEILEPRHSPNECRALGLPYAAPLRVRVRLNRQEPIEEDVYLGNMPLMLGGGEFIINGAERVIVTQLQRSPGVDFSAEIHSSGKRLHSCRIIPERGAWIQIEITAKDVIRVRVDRSTKLPATLLLRALSEKHSTDAEILRAFYPTEKIPLRSPKARERMKGKIPLEEVVDPKTGEVLIECREKLTADHVDVLRRAKVEEIEVISEVRDALILNTLAEDDAKNHDKAVIQIYLRMRPGSPVRKEKAEEFFRETFQDERRYNLGPTGRFRINRKLLHGVPDNVRTLSAKDFLHVLRYLLRLNSGRGGVEDARVDDIDHLENRRARTIKSLVMDEFRKGLIKLRRSVRERMSMKDVDAATPRTLINSQTVSSSIDYFFTRGELSQVVDQSNPLAQLTHERRLSALGPGGLNRKRAGFEVRDVHPSHYGRICPIETPEGSNIGLIVSLATYATINEMGFIVTPYYKVKNGRLTHDLVYLRADEEIAHYIAQADVPIDHSGRITTERVVARHREDFTLVDAKRVDLADVAATQLVGVAASLVPFLEHDDANRALMGSNMQRQAVPLLRPEPAVVSTGMEPVVARNSGMVIVSDVDGTVSYADSRRIVVHPTGSDAAPCEYQLRKYAGLNERTCLNQTPLVRAGDRVRKGQVLSEGAATRDGELALGRNVLVAFMSWEGYNFEDAIVASEKLLKDDALTSIHIEEFSVEIRETKLGREEITREVPNVSEAALRKLDEGGLIYVGTKVHPGDILVGKIAPKSKSELTAEEKLLHVIFGRAGEDVKNDSLVVKPGVEGYVLDVQHFGRKSPVEEGSRSEERRRIRSFTTEYNRKIAEVVREKFTALKQIVGSRMVNSETGEVYRVSPQDTDAEVIETDDALDLDRVRMHPSTRRKAKQVCFALDKRRRLLEIEKDRKIGKIKRGDELHAGVLELVKVYIAVKRCLSVGDKLAGRHGNKGVVSCILPEEDMPFLEDGTPIEMILNPLGVPSRMNLGQILETHLGWAAKKLGFRAVSPAFDGAKEAEIKAALREAELPEDGKAVLCDGRTGESFDQHVTVGYLYMIKLHHLVADKIHARATGPYSLITQQPLGGKARSGGQRFGEMEVWALEAYGAAHVLQEMLTVKSDDVEGRTKIYESMVRGENLLEPGTPLSFEVLMNEIRGLGLKTRLEKQRTEPLDRPAAGSGPPALPAPPASSKT